MHKSELCAQPATFYWLGRVAMAYTRPMSADDSIFAAYTLTALLVGGLIVVSWVRARRVKQALAKQESARRS